ncbi:MAG: hypothetical protein RLY71_3385 [Pseudomonadota bacterium]
MNFSFHDCHPDLQPLQTEVIAGLSGSPRQLPPKLFYDVTGSLLFERICAQSEYYIPAVECAIYATHAEEIIAKLGTDIQLIEPGAGSSRKVRFILDRRLPAIYVPMDISAEHLRASAQRLANDYPTLPVHAVCVDHTRPYELPAAIPLQRRVFFYPGSSLGNFDPGEAIHFLRDLRDKAGDDGALLIGIDTKKPVEILHRAYNDAAGVTATFNLNLLQRIRNELGADIDPDGFSHHAFYNAARSRIEMHLVSRHDQIVRVNGNTFHFAAGATIHTENSYKYRPDEFRQLAWEAGWASQHVWLDAREYFSVHLLRARTQAAAG